MQLIISLKEEWKLMAVRNRQENLKISVHLNKWRPIIFVLCIPEVMGIRLPPVSGASSSNIVDCIVFLQALLNHTYMYSGGW
jgi:hypothetical protein